MNKKAVLLSVQPKWCALIANGKKTVEVRKTRPKIETPFKCYIYQIKSKDKLLDVMKDGDNDYGTIYHGKPVFIKTLSPYSNGNEQKVIGEFTCDSISEYEAEFCKTDAFYQDIREIFRDADFPDDDGRRDFKVLTSNEADNPNDCDFCRSCCMTFDDVKAYIGEGFCKTFWGWHISNLKIYKKPKALSEFGALCDEDCPNCEFWKYDMVNQHERDMDCTNSSYPLRPLKRPPQSWCYVEVSGNE